MSIVILLIGTSGSGKSTFARTLGDEFKTISLDALRIEHTGDINDKSKDEYLYSVVKEMSLEILKSGYSVVVDTTNLKRSRRRDYIWYINEKSPDTKIYYKLFELDADLAKRRIKEQIRRGDKRAIVSDETIDRHGFLYQNMLMDIKDENIIEYKESIEFLLRKHPKYIELFSKFKNEPFERLKKLYDKLNTYRDIYDFKYISKLNTYEQVDDFISKLVIDKEKKDYVHQFLSNKYKHLVNDETIELFHQIRQVIGDDKSVMNDLIIKKIAQYRSVIDFNKDLNIILTNLTGEFNIKNIIKRIKLIPLFYDKRVVIYDIKSYQEMSKINNPKWCIVRDEKTFYTFYIKNLTKQYVLYDTSKAVTDSLHLIGVTIYPNGSIGHIHDYNDNNLKSKNKSMDIHDLYVTKYMIPDNKDIVDRYIEENIKYDVVNIMRYGLTEYFIKGVESGKADPSAKDNFVIRCASENGYLNIVKYLMSLDKSYKVDPSVKDNFAIRYAASNGYLDIVKYLMSLDKSYGIDPSVDNNFAIRVVAMGGHLDIVKYLISLDKSYGIDPSVSVNSVIRYAAGNGHLDTVKYLISLDKSYGIDPSADNNHAIQSAVTSGHLDIVKYLISLDESYGIDPSANDNYAIQMAAVNGKLDAIKYLMNLDKSYGIDPSAQDNFAIRGAAANGHLDIVDYLLTLDRVKETLSDVDYIKYTNMVSGI